MTRWGYGGRILDLNPRRPHGGPPGWLAGHRATRCVRRGSGSRRDVRAHKTRGEPCAGCKSTSGNRSRSLFETTVFCPARLSISVRHLQCLNGVRLHGYHVHLGLWGALQCFRWGTNQRVCTVGAARLPYLQWSGRAESLYKKEIRDTIFAELDPWRNW